MTKRKSRNRNLVKAVGSVRESGTVKMYNEERGFGFIEPRSGGSDVFVHVSELRQAGIFGGLKEGQSVLFRKFTQSNGRNAATDIEIDDDQKVIPIDQNRWYQGVIKWFDPDRGYGFIAPEDGKKDVFIHRSVLDMAGFHTTFRIESQKVRYKVGQGQNQKFQAIDVEFA